MGLMPIERLVKKWRNMRTASNHTSSPVRAPLDVICEVDKAIDGALASSSIPDQVVSSTAITLYQKLELTITPPPAQNDDIRSDTEEPVINEDVVMKLTSDVSAKMDNTMQQT